MSCLVCHAVPVLLLLLALCGPWVVPRVWRRLCRARCRVPPRCDWVLYILIYYTLGDIHTYATFALCGTRTWRRTRPREPGGVVAGSSCSILSPRPPHLCHILVDVDAFRHICTHLQISSNAFKCIRSEIRSKCDRIPTNAIECNMQSNADIMHNLVLAIRML